MSGLSGSRFTAQNQTTSDRLSTNTVGLVALSDFRKRRAEVIEQQEREAREAARGGAASGGEGAAAAAANGSAGGGNGGGSGSGDGSGATSAASAAGSDGDGDGPKTKKKRKRDGKKGRGGVTKLSFLGDEEEEMETTMTTETTETTALTVTSTALTTPSPSSLPVPKSFTKQALRRQAAEREALRKEFLLVQAAVKATEVAIPFVFYEGADIPGGVVRVKKGDFVWLFLDRSRKVGARLGVGEKKPSKARLHWARIGVDDLMLVRGNLILPHHYDFYFFIINKTVGPGGVRVFDYSAEAPEAAVPATSTTPTTSTASTTQSTAAGDLEEDCSMLEGASDDPSLTKVVDRRWYERNKHIYPANVWQDFDPEQDYTQQVRRDQGGNAYFFASK